jgi:hypothetical protein
MLDVLNAVAGTAQKVFQHRLALGKPVSPNVVPVEHKQVESRKWYC